MRRTRFLAGLAAGSLLATTTVAALAAPAGAGDDPPAPSQVTVVHGIPDVTVDVYAGGDLLLEDFEFGDFEGPVPVPAGSLDVQVFAADADPGTATPVIDDTLAIPAGETISLVANLDEGGAPELSPFIEDNDPVPFDNGRVSVRHTADAPAVDVLAEGGVLLPALPNGDEASAPGARPDRASAPSSWMSTVGASAVWRTTALAWPGRVGPASFTNADSLGVPPSMLAMAVTDWPAGTATVWVITAGSDAGLAPAA